VTPPTHRIDAPPQDSTELPAEVEQQIEKLSSDLVDAYEALTLVYRTVSNLGGLFRLEDIAAYLVNRSVEALSACAASLYLGAGADLILASEAGVMGDRLAEDACRRLLELRRPVFFHGALAADYTRPGADPIRNLLAAPLETGGRVLGILVATRDEDQQFTTGDLKLVSALCGLTAVAVANFQHYRAVNFEREMLEGVVREIGDGIVVADGDWRSSLTNGAARTLLGVDDTEPEGYDVLKQLSAFDLSTSTEDLRLREADGVEFLAESLDRRRPLVLGCKSFSARLGADGRPIRVLCLRDVTREHREAAAQRDFLSLASHKLRTPLSKIMGMLPIAKDGDADAAIKGEAFQGIEEGTEELRSLMGGVWQFVEFRQGTRVIRSIDLGELVRETVESVQTRRPGRTVEFDVQVDPKTSKVQGSRLMMETMLHHLVDNAVKFTVGDKAWVGVDIGPDVREGLECVKVVVRDKGEGIAPEQLKHLFEPFAQRDEDFTGQADGAGLGLMLVREAVIRHGGTIVAESKLGLGSTFALSIPVDGEHSA